MGRRGRVVAVVAIGAVLVGMGAVAIAGLRSPAAAPPPSEAATPAPLTAAEAIARVQALDPTTTGLAVTGTRVLPTGPAYDVGSSDVHATVDAATGRILSYLDGQAMPATATVVLTGDQAIAAAADYLRRNGIATDGLQPAVELLDHGESKEYQVTWTGRVNGVRVPENRTVSVDPATGRVYGFVQCGRPYASPPAPVLDEAAAETAARALLADPKATVASSDLAVAFDANGRQLLVYELKVTLSDGFLAWVQVDALSGAATVTARG